VQPSNVHVGDHVDEWACLRNAHRDQAEYGPHLKHPRVGYSERVHTVHSRTHHSNNITYKSSSSTVHRSTRLGRKINTYITILVACKHNELLCESRRLKHDLLRILLRLVGARCRNRSSRHRADNSRDVSCTFFPQSFTDILRGNSVLHLRNLKQL